MIGKTIQENEVTFKFRPKVSMNATEWMFGGKNFSSGKQRVKPGGETTARYRGDQEAGMAGVGKSGGLIEDMR